MKTVSLRKERNTWITSLSPMDLEKESPRTQNEKSSWRRSRTRCRRMKAVTDIKKLADASASCV